MLKSRADYITKMSKTKDYPKVSIIIVNYNGLNDTLECLDSLKKCSYSNFEIIVVDNGEIVNDGTHDELMSSEGLYRNLYEMQFKPLEI